MYIPIYQWEDYLKCRSIEYKVCLGKADVYKVFKFFL